MNINDLNDFPYLQKAYQSLQKPPQLDECFIAEIYQADYLKYGFSSWLKQVEDALLQLQSRLNDLEEHLNALFSPQIDKWGWATTELMGFMVLQQLGVLADIGWPPMSRKSPEFDGRICNLNGVLVPFDIKPAASSGLWLLLSECERLIETCHPGKGLSVELDCNGAISQELIGKNLKHISKDLLSNLNSLPIEPFIITVDKTNISVRIQKNTGVRVHGSVGSNIDYIRETIKNHITKKGGNAEKLNTPYMLIYIRPNACGGSDIDSSGLNKALQCLVAEPTLNSASWFPLLLGVILLDWTCFKGLQREGIFFKKAKWPTGMTPETIGKCLKLTAMGIVP